jgi:hypothetical protein
VLDQLIVVDYQEGAGGEFIASWLTSHFGQPLVKNSQKNPNYYQKWLNSYSLVSKGWDKKFVDFFQTFLTTCQAQGITRIAVPYHLYKWPHHVNIIKDCCPYVRFVRINCNGYEHEISAEFQRKVCSKKLESEDFGMVKFMLTHRNKEEIKHALELFKAQELTFNDLDPFRIQQTSLKNLPSQDVEINYQDFFVNFDNTKTAYQQLCVDLDMSPDIALLNALIDRNKKNWQDLQEYLNTV